MSKKAPLAIIGILFFIFGFITWLNSALVPFLKIACELNNFESYFVTFVFYIAYFIFALPSARIIDRIGYRRSITLGLLVMAAGGLLFIPAALNRFYLFFLTGLFLMGAGLALLQTAANPYAAILGPPETAARRISIMGVCNKFAGVLAPIAFGSVALKAADEIMQELENPMLDPGIREAMLDSLAHKCLVPYILIVVFLSLLALFVKYSRLPDINKAGPEDGNTDDEEAQSKHGLRLFARPALWGGVLALFFYVGAEVISVDTLIGNAMEHGMSPSSAKIFPAFSMIAFIIGYLLGIIGIPRLFSQRTALTISASASIIVTIAAILTPGITSLYILVWLGFTNAMIWPSVWGLAIQGLGKYTSVGSSLLIMAIVGGAIIPLAFGRIADTAGFQSSYWLIVPCYAYVLAYALFIGRPRRHSRPRPNLGKITGQAGGRE